MPKYGVAAFYPYTPNGERVNLAIAAWCEEEKKVTWRILKDFARAKSFAGKNWLSLAEETVHYWASHPYDDFIEKLVKHPGGPYSLNFRVVGGFVGELEAEADLLAAKWLTEPECLVTHDG